MLRGALAPFFRQPTYLKVCRYLHGHIQTTDCKHVRSTQLDINIGSDIFAYVAYQDNVYLQQSCAPFVNTRAFSVWLCSLCFLLSNKQTRTYLRPERAVSNPRIYQANNELYESGFDIKLADVCY